MMADYELAWSPEIEARETRAQQRRADIPKQRLRSSTDIVAACVEENPSITMRRIHELTGLTIGDVNGALYSLLKQERVERSHRQQDYRTRPVLWRTTHAR